MLHQPRMGILSQRERALLLAIAEAALPAGEIFPAAGPEVVDRVDKFLAALPASLQTGYRALLSSVGAAALLTRLRPLARLPVADRLAVLHAWRTGSVSRRLAMRALMAPIKVAHFDNPSFFQAIGCVYEFERPAPEKKPRYMTERAHDTAKLEEDLELEVDVVVIGTGAGGAVVGRELAERGHAVVMLEEGAYFDRSDFSGRAFEMQRKMYRNAGATFSLGNIGIPIPIGKTVGGSTTINSGTCYRVPRRVLRKWRDELGLGAFTEDMMAGYYQRVEQVLQVAEARPEYLGGVARVIARGCDALGYAHRPLRRNAPDCDGKGVCCFGCPTDAKRSTNVSYVPLALRAGAQLFYRGRADRVLIEHGRAVGVEASAVMPSGQVRRVTIRARAVVVACGALTTPTFLQRQGLANGSGELGKNLSIHPATGGAGLFDEDISGFNAIPQGYAIEEFHDEGLLFEGATTPLDITMAASPFLGPRLIEVAERYDRMATFGFMVEDSSRGRVRWIGGRQVITYVMNDRDVARLKRGHEILARVFFAAGATRVYPMINGFEELRGEDDLERLRRARLRARDFDVTAYHPLGTARMGIDPARSVVGPDHRVHDVPGLYIVDGSAVPSSIGVNPQVTIMAMATRAAELLSNRL
ncbi:MAG TPA: GMC family oxidoreductase [Kofleriaceae bacterium]|nr:GMC family oxidoreductase [Kofleriaceae bacterium]